MVRKLIKGTDKPLRYTLIGLSLVGLLLVFLFQRFNYAQLLGLDYNSTWRFIVNRTIRFLINDNLMILFIYALFYERKYVKFALWVELAGFLFLLVPYMLLRFLSPIDDAMYISFLHRLIVNPTLMLLLIPALYLQYQRN